MLLLVASHEKSFGGDMRLRVTELVQIGEG